MRKLKLKDIGKKVIITAIASTMIGSAIGCAKDKEEYKTVNNNEIVTDIDIKDNEINEGYVLPNEVAEDVEEIEEEIVEDETVEMNNQGECIEKLVINSVDDLKQIDNYDTIQYLKIDSANIKDFSFLKNKNIELLQIIRNKFPLDMNCVNKDCIKQLYFHNIDLKNTDTIGKFDLLENFVLKNDDNKKDIKNLDFLRNCKNLNNIEIENYAIENLDFAKNLVNLNAISIKDSAINNISGISNLKNLNSLTLEKANIKDVSCLKNSICSLDLSNNYIENIDNLNLEDTSYLNISNNLIKDVSNVKSGEFLSYINLSENYINKLPTNLINDEMSIDISSNRINNLSTNDKAILSNKNISINMFDNELDPNILKEIAKYPSVYFEVDEIQLNSNQAIEYNNKMKKILAGIDNSLSDEAKTMEIGKYVTNNINLDYSYSAEHTNDQYGALFDKVDCTGASQLGISLLRHLGIQSKMYQGDYMDTNDNSRHDWIISKVGDSWYHSDFMMSVTEKDYKGYPNIALLTDKEVSTYGHILDANNDIKCNREQLNRNNILQEIENTKGMDR